MKSHTRHPITLLTNFGLIPFAANTGWLLLRHPIFIGLFSNNAVHKQVSLATIHQLLFVLFWGCFFSSQVKQRIPFLDFCHPAIVRNSDSDFIRASGIELSSRLCLSRHAPGCESRRIPQHRCNQEYDTACLSDERCSSSP